jgi:hypothetical protein
MRKSLSILLLFVLLFNMIGYRAVFYYAEKKSDASLEARLDKELYEENELVTVKIPLFNPYQIEQKTFERVNGEININGKIFKYVKRKVSDGNLILLCIADDHKNVLKKAKSDYENATNDLAPISKNSGHSGIQKNVNGNDYINQYASVEVWKSGSSIHNHTVWIINKIPDPLISSPGKPPEANT